MCSVQSTGGSKLLHSVDVVAPAALVGDVTEAALDHGQPTSARRDDANHETPVTDQSLLPLAASVCRKAVYSQMRTQVVGCAAADPLRASRPPAATVLCLAHLHHTTAACAERRRGHRRAFAHTVMRDDACITTLDRQARRLAVQGLDLAHLVKYLAPRVTKRIPEPARWVEVPGLKARLAAQLQAQIRVKLHTVSLQRAAARVDCPAQSTVGTRAFQ